jgi:serine/threonine-protein kinase
MEYLCMNIGVLTGESYQAEKPARRLTPERAARYMDQLLSGLDRLHHAGIIHRDIKPYNILLTDDDRVKIIDMGLSRLRGEVRELPESFKVGTPFYAAPEQEAKPDQADERADLYSAGIMLWRMLTGELPPEFEAPRPPSELNPFLGLHWDDLLLKAIRRERELRFQSCREMRQAVADAYEHWRDTMERECSRRPEPAAEKQAGEGHSLRARPLKVSRADAPAVFDTDPLNQPAGAFPAGRFVQKGGTLEDGAHRLVWQQDGSPYPLSWEEARDYIERMNRMMSAGRADWRLPTVDELLSILQPRTVMGDYCQGALFDETRTPLWSADTKSFTAAWMVETETGFAESMDKTCRFYVRAVASVS